MSSLTYRRGSIFWALTLIAVGVLFLYQNFNPNVHPWQIIAKFWPVLVIFWGCSKLIDYLQARSHAETAPPALFSGSEVVLLLLILLLGTMVSKIVLHSSSWGPWVHVDDEDWGRLFGSSYTYTAHVSQPVQAPGSLVIVNRRGDIEVDGSDQATIDAVVNESIRADNESAAKKLSDQLQFQIVSQAGHYVLQSNVNSLPDGGRNVRFDITLRVPASMNTDLTTERGDLILKALKGDQNLTTHHGDVRISDTQGLVRMRVSNGSIDARDIKGNVDVEGNGSNVQMASVDGVVTVDGDFSGDMQFRSISQTVRYKSSRTDLTVQKLTGKLDMSRGSLEANGIGGPFDLTTREKDISLDNFQQSVKISNTNGDVQLRTGTALAHPIDVSLNKGEISLAIPSNSSFQIDASSNHGEVESEFSGPGLKVNTEGDMPTISGSYGQGGPSVRLSTSYGAVRLTRFTGEPAAPSQRTEKRIRPQACTPALLVVSPQ